MTTVITRVEAHDARYQLQPGEGTDAVHSNPMYAYAVTRLHTSDGHIGTGLVLTLGGGNELVTAAITLLAESLVGRDIEETMAEFGNVQRQLADHSQLRWLGPHKGIIHLALASITNACFDVWAKSRGVPLWSLLLDLEPEQVVALLDLSYLEDVLTEDQATQLLSTMWESRSERSHIVRNGYPGYDTSIGWIGYSDERMIANARESVRSGFDALKLKVGSRDATRDIYRVQLLRNELGPDVRLMVDVNQQWSVPQAIEICEQLQPFNLYWVEEPTHPDDVLGHQTLARELQPIQIAIGEHVPNRIAFKNYLQAGAAHIVQVDCTRVAGISEFITVSMLALQANVPVVPHVGDMGQIHQHLVLFNHIALGHEVVFLEHIPHLSQHFRHPAHIVNGRYRTPQEPGASADLV